MTVTDITGAAGVSILLLGFLLNLSGKITRHSIVYLLLNTLGAALACMASVLLHYWPFIILEGCWTTVSAIGLLLKISRKKI